MSSKITDTSEIKNSINGFDLVECYFHSNTKLYISFPNLGAGMLAQTAASAHPDILRIEPGDNHIYKIIMPSEETTIQSNKQTKFVPYSGMSREMFITSIDITSGCGASTTFGNTMQVCVPWKIYTQSDISEYINTTITNVLVNDLYITDNELSNTLEFDYYLNTFKIALDTIKGNSGKYEELMDGLAASIIRYATSGIDIIKTISDETDEGEEVLLQEIAESKWARPYNINIDGYFSQTDRAEYTDLFSEKVDKDIYFNKLITGNTDVQINDIYVKPCVLFGIEDGQNNRLFYSKELSDKVFEGLKITGHNKPPQIEYTRNTIVYGYDDSDGLGVASGINSKETTSLSGDLDLTYAEYDKLSGSGFYILDHVQNICKDIEGIQVLDWSGDNESPGSMVERDINLTTPRPPIFSMGDAFLDQNLTRDESPDSTNNPIPILRVPFNYSYILPSNDEGYITREWFTQLDTLGSGYYPAEGYYPLIHATRDYLTILSKVESEINQQSPIKYPTTDASKIAAFDAGAWRYYQNELVEIVEGVVSGLPLVPKENLTESIDTRFTNYPIPDFGEMQYIIDETNVIPLPNRNDYFNDVIDQTNYDIDLNKHNNNPEYPLPDIADYTTAQFNEVAYNNDILEYNNNINSQNKRISIINAFIGSMYADYNVPTCYEYDYNLYPIITKDSASFIRAQMDDEDITTIKPDKGAGIYKPETATYDSVSMDASYVDINNTGVIDINDLLRKYRVNKSNTSEERYLDKVPDIINSITGTIMELKIFMGKYILQLDHCIDLPNGKMYPVFSNNKCSAMYAIEDPSNRDYFTTEFKNNLMFLFNEEDQLPDSEIDALIKLWSKTSGSPISNLISDCTANRIDKIKTYANTIRNEIIEPTRNICYDLSAILIGEADSDHYFLYYKKNTGTSYGQIAITPEMQKLGTWFYNIRKVYLLIISIISLIESFADGIDNYMVAVLNDHIPKILPNLSGEIVSYPLNYFAFLNGEIPLYPILLNDIDVTNIPEIKLNHISYITPEPETFIYRISLDLTESSEILDGVAVVMPGFGVSPSLVDPLNENRIFWNKDSFIANQYDKNWIEPEDITTLNSKFAYLQQGISQDDYVAIVDGNLSIMNAETSQPINITSQEMENIIKNTKRELPEIPAITINGIMDAGLIFPFYDKKVTLKTNTASVEVLYQGMYPIYINNSLNDLAFENYNTTQLLDIKLSTIIKDTQDDPRAGKKDTTIFKTPGDISDSFENILKSVSYIFKPNVLDAFILDDSPDKDINITVTSHSFNTLNGTYTNNILQGYLLKDNELMTENNIIDELKSSAWIDYRIYTSSPIHKRNANLYLSKRRSHYTSYVLFLMLVKQLAEDNGGNESLTSNNDGFIITTKPRTGKPAYRLTFKITDTSPTEPNSYKLFNSYGFGGLFFNLNTTDTKTIKDDINESIRSQIKISDNLANSRSIVYEGPNSLTNKNDRVSFNITIDSNQKTGTAILPDECILFPNPNTGLNKEVAGITASNNLAANFGKTKPKPYNTYEAANVKQAKEKAQIFINNNLDCFRIDSFIDKIWVIIEQI